MEYRSVAGVPTSFFEPWDDLEDESYALGMPERRKEIEFQMLHEAIILAMDSEFYEKINFCAFNSLFFPPSLLFSAGHNDSHKLEMQKTKITEQILRMRKQQESRKPMD